MVASCREAGLAPTFAELPDAHLERALLAVAPGVRFVPLNGDQPAVAVAALTRRDSSNLPTAAFLRELSRAGESTASLQADARHGRGSARGSP